MRVFTQVGRPSDALALGVGFAVLESWHKTGTTAEIGIVRIASPPPRPLVHGLAAALSIFGLIAFCIWTGNQQADDVLAESLDSELQTLARLAAQRIDPERHAKLQDPAQMDGPEYREVVGPLRSWLARVPELRYAYTLRPSPEGPRFVVDAADPVDDDGDGVIDQASLLEIYEDPDPSVERAFRSRIVVSSKPYTDKWGTFVSAFAPVFRADGSLECVVGVDMTAKANLERMARMDRAALNAAAVALLISLAMGAGVFAIQYRRRAAALNLVESESRFRDIADASPVMIWTADCRGRADYFSRGWQDFTGVIIGGGRSRMGFVHPEDRARLLSLQREAFEARRPFEIEYRLRRFDGEDRWVMERGRPRFDSGSRFLGFIAGTIDLTESRRAKAAIERARASAEAKLSVAQALANRISLVERMDQAIAALQGTDPSFGGGGVYLHDPEEKLYRIFVARGDAAMQVAREAPIARPSGGPCGEAATSLDIVRIPPIEPKDPENAAPPEGVVYVPIVALGGRDSRHSIGVVYFTTRDAAEEPDDESLREISGLFATAIAQDRAVRTLDEARRRAEEAVRAKSEFLATISHEIRTPMNGVLGVTSLLLETSLSDQQSEYIQTIRGSGEALLTIINDLLDFSRIESGHMSIEELDFDLKRIIDETMRNLAPQVGAKPVRLAADTTAIDVRGLRGDPGRLRQVILNLVGNAIKFTAEGEVILTARTEKVDSQIARIHLEVRDTGIGMPEQVIGQLFKPFSQGDASTTRRFGGTGLGLAISRKIVELMGGTLNVESEEGRGSRFWVDLLLPLGAEVQTEVPTVAPVEADAPLPTLRVLLAEDNPVNQLVARRMLEKFGCAVDVAVDGVEAVQHHSSNEYDIIFMDWQMPNMDGVEATRIIRAKDGSARVPIIALTANAMAGDRDRCDAAGMDDFLSKPIRAEELNQVLRRWTPSTRMTPAG